MQKQKQKQTYILNISTTSDLSIENSVKISQKMCEIFNKFSNIHCSCLNNKTKKRFWLVQCHIYEISCFSIVYYSTSHVKAWVSILISLPYNVMLNWFQKLICLHIYYNIIWLWKKQCDSIMQQEKKLIKKIWPFEELMVFRKTSWSSDNHFLRHIHFESLISWPFNFAISSLLMF